MGSRAVPEGSVVALDIDPDGNVDIIGVDDSSQQLSILEVDGEDPGAETRWAITVAAPMPANFTRAGDIVADDENMIFVCGRLMGTPSSGWVARLTG